MKARANCYLIVFLWCLSALLGNAASFPPDSVGVSDTSLISNRALEKSDETAVSFRRSFSFDRVPATVNELPLDDDNLGNTFLEMEDRLENAQAIIAARQKINDAISAGRFLQRLDSLAWIEFPVVLADTISNVPIHIVFDNLRLYPDYAQLEVVIGMELPQRKVGAMTNQNMPGGSGNPNGGTEYVELFFGTPNLKFSHDGGIIGDALIGLYSDTPIGSTNPSKFGMILRPWHQYGNGANTQDLGTYVKIDCDGFVEMGLEADLLFSRDWIVPVDANANPKPTGRVQGHIQTIVNDWQNILVQVSLPNFAPASYTDIAFNLSTAVFDFSDFRNSPNVEFPEAYTQQGLLPSNPTLWRGVFIKNLELTLPKQIKKKDCVATNGGGGSQPGGSGMLILDERGMYAYGDVFDPPASHLASHGPAPPELNLSRPPAADYQWSASETEDSQIRGISPPAEVYTDQTATINSCRTTIGVDNLLIDGHGVSGHFYAENVLNIGDGSMDRWRYSISDLEVELVTNQVVGFGFGGEVGIPISKKTQNFGYSAFVNIPDRTYNFNVSVIDTLTFPVFKFADVSIHPGSYLDITATPSKFVPVAVLSGFAQVKGKLGSKEDDSEAPSDSLRVTAPRINFHLIRLATQGTKLDIMPGGHLEFDGEINVMGYNIPIADPTLERLPNGKLKFKVNISFNLTSQNDNGFAVTTNVNAKGKLETEDGNDQWNSDGLDIEGILVDIKFPSLEIYGYAYIFDNDPVYGKGFQGSLSVKIGPYEPPEDPMLTVELNAMFGQTTFKYWYVDGFVEWNTAAPGIILGPIEINGFGGGAYYHMKMESVNLAGGTDGSMGTMTSGAKYVPYEPTTLGLKATVAFKSPGTEVLDGVATLELRFGGAALQEIMFYGKAEIVPKNGIPAPNITKFSDKLRDRISDLPLSEAASKAKDKQEIDNPYDRILATAFIRMNFEEGFEFQGTFRVFISAAQGVITGQGGVDFLFSTPQDRWHIYVGGYAYDNINNAIIAGDGEPLPPIGVSLNLGQGITAGADAYFLTGNDIPGPPPLHPQAAAYFGISEQPPENRNQLNGRAAAGTGFAFGAAVFANIDKRIRNRGSYSNNSVQAQIGAGFDVSLLKYSSDTRCSISGTSPHGHKGWRATGRLWAYINGRAKYRGIGKNLDFGVLIDADLPKPAFLRIYVRFRLVININLEVDIGDRCGTPYYN
ncbi:MAG: hypothetical protein AAGF87_04070 [Bacteroidota bacterium]